MKTNSSSTNFYPRPPRGGRPDTAKPRWSEHLISTHALREEGDLEPLARRLAAEGFLPTPSARRATGGEYTYTDPTTISTHALREEGDHLHSAWSRRS